MALSQIFTNIAIPSPHTHTHTSIPSPPYTTIAVAERSEVCSEQSVRQFLPTGATLLRVFGGWLFEGVNNTENPSQIRAQITAVLCRLFCSRTEEPFQDVFLAQFYQLIRKVRIGSNVVTIIIPILILIATSGIGVP